MIRNIYNNSLEIKDKEYAYILAGVAGSGKTFILNNILSNNNKIFSIDNIKQNILKIKNPNSKIWKKFQNKHKINISDLDLKNHKDITLLHNFCLNEDYLKRQMYYFFSFIKKKRPSIFFDTTLRRIGLIDDILYYLELGNYNKRNIKIIWVYSSLDVCIERNKRKSLIRDSNTLKDEYINVIKTLNEICRRNIIYIENIYMINNIKGL